MYLMEYCPFQIKGEEDSTNSFTVELDRFKETLDKMIAKNSNKRLKAHSRYVSISSNETKDVQNTCSNYSYVKFLVLSVGFFAMLT